MAVVSAKGIWKWIVSGSLCVCATGGIVLGWRNWTPQPSVAKLHDAAANLEADVSAFVLSMRPIYPYSVIRGGVYSSRELRNSMARDALVASHYADFDIAHAVLVRTTAPMLRYVSYRKGGHVIWTRKPLRIPKNEVLLSDGIHFARSRCGNRLSSNPVGPAPKDEPDVELSIPDLEPPRSNLRLAPLEGSHPFEPDMTFLRPELPTLLSPLESDAELYDANPTGLTPIPTAPGRLIPGNGAPPIAPFFPAPLAGSPTVAPVPEPSTRGQVTLVLAIAVLVFGCKRARRKPEGSSFTVIRGKKPN